MALIYVSIKKIAGILMILGFLHPLILLVPKKCLCHKDELMALFLFNISNEFKQMLSYSMTLLINNLSAPNNTKVRNYF